jgi:hydrogenase-4 component B
LTTTPLLLAWIWPLTLAASAWGQWSWWTPAVGALPALTAALLVPVGSTLDIPWLLLGAKLGMDAAGRVFLLFTSIVWLAAGIYTASGFRHGRKAARFRVLFLLAMAGNLWLIVAQDVVSFYTGFALMGLSSYGLVVHDGDAAALRAGRVYIAMSLMAEVALFLALVLIARQAGLTPSPQGLLELSNWAIGLILFGLAIKAGLVPMHLWLPLAHPAAPAPASAVLSGTMIKVGLLGWLRFLPLGRAALPEWGAVITGVGLATLLLALPVGMTQTNPKVILAYSSVSKMGMIAVGLGLILTDPALAPAGVGALLLYAGHHALVKGGLFLGIGLRKEARAASWVLAGLAFLALALAGAPFTSGALAKYDFKPLLDAAEWPWLPAAVTFGTLGAVLLMARFLWVTRRIERHPRSGLRSAMIAWVLLIMLVALFPFALGTPAAWPTNAAPVAAGAAIGAAFTLAARFKPAMVRPLVGVVPPGDLVELGRPLASAVRTVARAERASWSAVRARWSKQLLAFAAALPRPAQEPDRALRAWPTAGLLWLTLTASLLVALIQPLGSRLRLVSTPEQALRESPGPPIVPEPDSESPRHPAPAMRAASAETGSTAAESAARTPSKEEVTAATPPPAAPKPAEGPTPPAPRSPRISDQTENAVAPAPSVCVPPTYVFRFAGETLRLERCELGSTGEATVRSAPVLSNRLVELLQRSLKALGLDPGKVDGLIGPRTRGAVRRLRESEEMRPSGLITFDLLDRIQQRLADRKAEHTTRSTRRPTE